VPQRKHLAKLAAMPWTAAPRSTAAGSGPAQLAGSSRRSPTSRAACAAGQGARTPRAAVWPPCLALKLARPPPPPPHIFSLLASPRLLPLPAVLPATHLARQWWDGGKERGERTSQKRSQASAISAGSSAPRCRNPAIIYSEEQYTI
jgi:hypothetical protein